MIKKVFTIDLDFGAGPLAEQNTIAGLYIEGDHLAGLVASAIANGNDFAFLRLFLRGIRNDDATGGLFFGIDAADNDTVVQRTKCHLAFSSHGARPTLNGSVLA